MQAVRKYACFRGTSLCELDYALGDGVDLKDVLVVYDFDLTLNAAIIQSDGKRKGELRGGETTRKLLHAFKTGGAKQIILSAASASQQGYASIVAAAKQIGLDDIFDLTVAKVTVDEMETGEKLVYGGDVFLAGYEKPAGIEFARTLFNRKIIAFADDFVANAFNVAVYWVSNPDVPAPEKVFSMWYDPKPLIEQGVVKIGPEEDSYGKDYAAYYCAAVNGLQFSSMGEFEAEMKRLGCLVSLQEK